MVLSNKYNFLTVHAITAAVVDPFYITVSVYSMFYYYSVLSYSFEVMSNNNIEVQFLKLYKINN